MRRNRAIISLLMAAIVVMLMPMTALGEGAAMDLGLDHNMVEMNIRDITVTAGDESIDLGLSVDLYAAVTNDLESGLLGVEINVDETGANALTAAATVEGGAINFFAQNDGGSLPYVLSMQLSDLADAMGLDDLMDPELFEDTQPPEYYALMDSLMDAEYLTEVSLGFINHLATADYVQVYAGENVDILGQTMTADRMSIEMSPASLVDMVLSLKELWPEFYDYLGVMLAEEGMSLSDLEELTEEDLESDEIYSMNIWMAGEYAAMVLDISDDSDSAVMSLELYMPDEQNVRVRFAFNTDSSGESSSGYIDATVSGDDSGSAVEAQVVIDNSSDYSVNTVNLMLTQKDTYPTAAGGKGAYESSVAMSVDQAQTYSSSSYSTKVNMSIGYTGTYQDVDTGAATPDRVHDGAVYMDASMDGEKLGSVSFTAVTTIGHYEGGATLTDTGLPLMDPYRADSEQMEEFSTALETLGTNIMVILMQSPALSTLLMGGIADGGLYTG